MSFFLFMLATDTANTVVIIYVIDWHEVNLQNSLRYDYVLRLYKKCNSKIKSTI